MKNEAPDLGKGKIGSLMVKLALPSIIAQLVNLLYNMVDRIYIGHIPENGDMALTGLGLCFPILMMVSAFASLIGFGGAPRVAINMGKGMNEKAEEIVGNCITALVIIAIVLTVITQISAVPLLRIFGASDVTLPYAESYLRIYLLGSICVLVSIGMNPFINAQGFSKIGMKTVVIGAICNIVLDPIFIFKFGMGVKGAALATIISQGVSMIWVMNFLTGSKTKIRIKRENLRVRKEVLLPVLALGIAPFVMNLTESAINIAFNMSLSKYGGDLAVGAMTILASIMQFMFIPSQGLTQGAQPIMSFNYGAGNTERVKATFRLLLKCCLIYSMTFVLMIELFPEVFVRLFHDKSMELINLTTWALRVYMSGCCILGVLSAVQSAFMALGQAKMSLFVACSRKLIFLIPLIFVLPHFFENKVFAIFLAEPVADVMAVIIASVLFAANIDKILQTKAK